MSVTKTLYIDSLVRLIPHRRKYVHVSAFLTKTITTAAQRELYGYNAFPTNRVDALIDYTYKTHSMDVLVSSAALSESYEVDALLTKTSVKHRVDVLIPRNRVMIHRVAFDLLHKPTSWHNIDTTTNTTGNTKTSSIDTRVGVFVITNNVDTVITA